MTGSGDNQTLTKDVSWPFMLNTECHYLDMDAIELVLSPLKSECSGLGTGVLHRSCRNVQNTSP